MQKVAVFMPLYHNGLRRIMVYNDVHTALQSYLIIGLMAIAMAIVAILLTKWRDF